MRKSAWVGCVSVLLLISTALGFVFGANYNQGIVDKLATNDLETLSTAISTIEQFRTEREQLRQMQKEQLSEMIYGGNANDEIIAMAQRKLLEIMTWEEQELTLEGALNLRDFSDTVVTVHTDSVNVMVRTDSLTQQQTAVILELVLRETGISGGNVKIIPIN